MLYATAAQGGRPLFVVQAHLSADSSISGLSYVQGLPMPHIFIGNTAFLPFIVAEVPRLTVLSASLARGGRLCEAVLPLGLLNNQALTHPLQEGLPTWQQTSGVNTEAYRVQVCMDLTRSQASASNLLPAMFDNCTYQIVAATQPQLLPTRWVAEEN